MICPEIFAFVTESYTFVFFNRTIEKGRRSLWKGGLKKTEFKIQTHQKKKFRTPSLFCLVFWGTGYSHIFVSFWRHGRVVRRGTANPFSPVQIRVSPDRQENWNSLFRFVDRKLSIFFFQRKQVWEKDSWDLFDSKF